MSEKQVIGNRPLSNPRVQMHSNAQINLTNTQQQLRKVTRTVKQASDNKFIKGSNIVVLPVNQMQFNRNLSEMDSHNMIHKSSESRAVSKQKRRQAP